MKSKLSIIPAICAIPAGQSDQFEGVIDLVRMKFIDRDLGDKTHVKYALVDIPEKYRALAEEYRHHLLEAASHADDHLVELILEGHEVPDEVLLRALRAGTLGMKLTPILCGSAKNFHGIQLLLDSVVDYLPSPSDRPPVTGIVPKSKDKAERKPDPKEPFSCLAFKKVSESPPRARRSASLAFSG
jgi:elongation factor G